MRTIAILAVLVGALELLNVVGAATAPGHGAPSATAVAILIVVAIAATLLLASGLAFLLRRAPVESRPARG